MRLLCVSLLLASLVAIRASAPVRAFAAELLAPSASEIEAAIPEGDRLTGREIYDRFLANKFRQSLQQLRVISMDPGGSQQTTAFTASLQDHRDEKDQATNGVLAKMLVEVSAPFDMRHTSYLMISKDPGPDDEFVYQPSTRKVKRVNLKDTPLMGTDYTFNDIAFQELEDADYVRMSDEVINGTPVYVVEANIKETIDVEVHRTLSYLEKEHYIPLRIRYWDDYGVEIKELTAPADKIRSFGDAWVATESQMTDLMQSTTSMMFVLVRPAGDALPEAPWKMTMTLLPVRTAWARPKARESATARTDDRSR